MSHINRPNILIFMTDQQNGWTVKHDHHPRAKTPHLDKFRKRAVSFTNAYSPSPHCCPSRVSFHTSKYPSEHGVWNNVNVANALTRGPVSGTPFWSRLLADQGYRMGFCGKWHVSNFEPPSQFGWEEIYVTSRGYGEGLSLEEQNIEARQRELDVIKNTRKTSSTPKEPGEIVRPGWPKYTHFGTHDNPFGDGTVVARARQTLEQYGKTNGRADPWCLYVGTLGPHDPYIPPKKFLDWYDPDEIELPQSFEDPMDDKPGLYSRTRGRFDQLSREEHREALRHYLAFCSYQDALFGELIDQIDAMGQLDNTIILYLSDHGDYAAEHGLWGKGLPAFQSAYRIPLIMGGPNVHAKRFDTESTLPVSVVDIGPTLLDLCHITHNQHQSGHSLMRWLAGDDQAAHDRDIFFQSNGNEAYGIQRVVFSSRWKLVHNMFDHDELYDLHLDPDELTNLLSQPPRTRKLGRGPLDTIPENLQATVEDLYRRLWTFCLEHNDENINDYILTALGSFGPGIVAPQPRITARNTRPGDPIKASGE